MHERICKAKVNSAENIRLCLFSSNLWCANKCSSQVDGMVRPVASTKQQSIFNGLAFYNRPETQTDWANPGRTLVETGRLHNNLPKNRYYSIKTCHIWFVFLICALNCCYTNVHAPPIVLLEQHFRYCLLLFCFCSVYRLRTKVVFKWCETIGTGFSHFGCDTSNSTFLLVLHKHLFWRNDDHYTQKK